MGRSLCSTPMFQNGRVSNVRLVLAEEVFVLFEDIMERFVLFFRHEFFTMLDGRDGGERSGY